ncbi:hypothetical protein L596_027987 [Steinernema carpocapsae]|nr:hypothetical protein L596_027987 [Steinernema carpocapsae]
MAVNPNDALRLVNCPKETSDALSAAVEGKWTRRSWLASGGMECLELKLKAAPGNERSKGRSLMLEILEESARNGLSVLTSLAMSISSSDRVGREFSAHHISDFYYVDAPGYAKLFCCVNLPLVRRSFGIEQDSPEWRRRGIQKLDEEGHRGQLDFWASSVLETSSRRVQTRLEGDAVGFPLRSPSFFAFHDDQSARETPERRLHRPLLGRPPEQVDQLRRFGLDERPHLDRGEERLRFVCHGV